MSRDERRNEERLKRSEQRLKRAQRRWIRSGQRLKRLCLASGILTLIFGAVDIALCLTMIVFHTCGAEVDFEGSSGWFFFYKNYVAGDVPYSKDSL